MNERGRKRYWLLMGLFLVLLISYMVYPFLEGVVYGLFIYYIARPVRSEIESIIDHRNASSALSLLIIISLILIPAFISIAYILETIYAWLPTLVDLIQKALPPEQFLKFEEIIKNLQVINFEFFLGILQGSDLNLFLAPLQRITQGFFWFLLILFIAIVTSFYMLMDDKNLMKWLKSAVPEYDRPLVSEYFKSLDESLDRIFLGVFLTMILTSIFALVFLTLLNAIAPVYLKISAAMIIVLAILCGVFNLLPGIGIKIIWVPVFIAFTLQAYSMGLLVESLWYLLLFAGVMAAIVDFIPDQILRPYLCGMGLHTGLVLLSFLFGTAVFGAKGIFLGPIILAAFVEYMRVILPELGEKHVIPAGAKDTYEAPDK